ncbi:MAG TPA: hypothetical protein VGI58_08125 [Streptosporangiaceae bacterium]
MPPATPRWRAAAWRWRLHKHVAGELADPSARMGVESAAGFLASWQADVDSARATS